MDADRLRLAMQRSGRLSDASFELLSKCGLHISRSRTELFCRIEELPIDLLLVRDDDIPGFVEEGVCDLGIVGENVVEEKRRAASDGFKTETILPLGYARCRLVLAVQERAEVPRSRRPQGPAHRHHLSRHAEGHADSSRRGGRDRRHERIGRGGASAAYRDAICDIVQTGATLEANGLKPVHTLLDSQALLIGRKDRLNGGKSAIAERLIKRIQGALKASEKRNTSAPRAPFGAAGDRPHPAGRRVAHGPAAGEHAGQGGGACGQPRERVLGDDGAAEGRRRQRHPGPADREDDGLSHGIGRGRR